MTNASEGRQPNTVGELRRGAVEAAISDECRPLFDRESLAAYLRLSTDTVDRLVKAGQLPSVRIGHQVRFTAEDVESFLERNRRLGPAA